jgi:hypothetical protein
VGQANFDWIVKEVADLAIEKAKTAPHVPELRWAGFLGTEPVAPVKAKKKAAKKKVKKVVAKAGAGEVRGR